MEFKTLDKFVPFEIYSPTSGVFSLASRPETGAIVQNKRWFSCREEFASCWADNLNLSLIFTINNQTIEKIAEFVCITEKKLGLTTYSKFFKFNHTSNIILIEVSAWWKESEVRRQFFTALLRSSLNYVEEKDYETALYSAKYFKESRPAVEYFLAGNTFWGNRDASIQRQYGWSYWLQNCFIPQSYLRNTPLEEK